MKAQHGTSPRDRSDRRARHQALARAEKQADRRTRINPPPYPDSEPCPNGACVACSGTGWVGPNFRVNRGLPPYQP